MHGLQGYFLTTRRHAHALVSIYEEREREREFKCMLSTTKSFSRQCKLLGLHAEASPICDAAAVLLACDAAADLWVARGAPRASATAPAYS